MSRKVVRRIVLTTFADFSNGMGTAWAFAAYDSLNRYNVLDLLSSLFLAILSLILAISIKLKLEHDKYT
jgi:hypothetical protein